MPGTLSLLNKRFKVFLQKDGRGRDREGDERLYGGYNLARGGRRGDEVLFDEVVGCCVVLWSYVFLRGFLVRLFFFASARPFSRSQMLHMAAMSRVAGTMSNKMFFHCSIFDLCSHGSILLPHPCLLLHIAVSNACSFYPSRIIP